MFFLIQDKIDWKVVMRIKYVSSSYYAMNCSCHTTSSTHNHFLMGKNEEHKNFNNHMLASNCLIPGHICFSLTALIDSSNILFVS